jgi:hypothetical protein
MNQILIAYSPSQISKRLQFFKGSIPVIKLGFSLYSDEDSSTHTLLSLFYF